MPGKSARPEFRRSQGIVPHGVGSIIDFPDESLMAAGLDAWPVEALPDQKAAPLKRATLVSDARLRARLTRQLGRHINALYAPPEAPEQNGAFGFAVPTGPSVPRGYTPFVRFPSWHFCPRCRAMQQVPWNASSGDSSLSCSNMRFRRRAQKSTDPCGSLPNYRKPKLVPVRFIAACNHGHIRDFPWSEWAHAGKRSCGADQLFLVSTGGAGLAGIKVECAKCGANRTMQGAFTKDKFKRVTDRVCTGERPWLGPDASESCGEDLQVVQRGASNIYFANVVSSILIPPHSQALRRILDDPVEWGEITDILDGIRIDGEPPPIRAQMFKGRAERRGLEPETFADAVREKYLSPDKWTGTTEESEEAYRYAERQAFLGPRPAQSERDEFDLKRPPLNEYDDKFSDLVSNVVLLPRLRETRALTGFTRLVPPEGSGDDRMASLSRARLAWMPAVSATGEGIYIELDAEKLAAWENNNQTLVSRCKLINKQAALIAQERGTTHSPVSARLVIAHTLSHLLIRQFSFACGYDTSSLKERLYVSTEDDTRMCGVLIYTASGDSEGSLGGLVRQGEPGRLEATVTAAIQNALHCASDPLCYESEGQGYYGMNLAACHACALLPETACELGNRQLDRQLIIGGVGSNQAGYFEHIAG